MRQFAVSLIAQVKDNELEPLRHVLEDRDTALMQALGRIGTIHYARWVIIEPIAGDKALLVFESNFDGDADAPINNVIRTHIDEIVHALGPQIDDVYTHCEGYTPIDKLSYLFKIRRTEPAFYQGSPGRTVTTIAQEKALRTRLVLPVMPPNRAYYIPCHIPQPV